MLAPINKAPAYPNYEVKPLDELHLESLRELLENTPYLMQPSKSSSMDIDLLAPAFKRYVSKDQLVAVILSNNESSASNMQDLHLTVYMRDSGQSDSKIYIADLKNYTLVLSDNGRIVNNKCVVTDDGLCVKDLKASKLYKISIEPRDEDGGVLAVIEPPLRPRTGYEKNLVPAF